MMRRVDAAFALAGALLLSSAARAQEPVPEEGPEVSAISALKAAVAKGDDAATLKAATALAALGEPAAIRLAATPPTAPASDLVWALRCVKVIGSPVGSAFAAGLATHKEPLVRAEALISAAVLLKAEAAPLCFAAIRDADVNVRRRAFDGLLAVAAETSEAADAAVLGVVDPDFWVATVAMRILEQSPPSPPEGPDQVGVALAAAADRAAAIVVKQVYAHLVRRAPAAARSAVERGLGSERADVRTAAVGAAAALGARDLAPRVLKVASDVDVKVAKAAIEAVSVLNAAETLEGLVDLLEASTTDKARRDALAVALRKMTGKLHGLDVAAWRRELARR